MAAVSGIGMLALALGTLSVRQRKWIVERDKEKCQAWNASMKGPHDGGLQVHHVEPQMQGYLDGKTESEIDTPDNAVTLCENHHVKGVKADVIHNDQNEYVERYRSGDHDAFREMQADRREKLENGEPYWNTKFDRGLKKLAEHNTKEHLKKGAKPFPPHNHRK